MQDLLGCWPLLWSKASLGPSRLGSHLWPVHSWWFVSAGLETMRNLGGSRGAGRMDHADGLNKMSSAACKRSATSVRSTVPKAKAGKIAHQARAITTIMGIDEPSELKWLTVLQMLPGRFQKNQTQMTCTTRMMQKRQDDFQQPSSVYKFSAHAFGWSNKRCRAFIEAFCMSFFHALSNKKALPWEKTHKTIRNQKRNCWPCAICLFIYRYANL